MKSEEGVADILTSYKDFGEKFSVGWKELNIQILDFVVTEIFSY